MTNDLRERVAVAAEGMDTSTVDAAREVADAAIAEMGGIRVKPLFWMMVTPDYYEKAERFGMVYTVTRDHDGNGWIACASPRWSSKRDTAKFDERDLARDWCEDHNRTRILAAIEPASVSVQEAARVFLDLLETRTKDAPINATAMQAAVAAAYEDAADCIEGFRGGIYHPEDVAAAIRARTDTDAQAALERVKREVRNEALKRPIEKARDIMTLEEGETEDNLTGYSRGVYFTAKAILALMEDQSGE